MTNTRSSESESSNGPVRKGEQDSAWSSQDPLVPNRLDYLNFIAVQKLDEAIERRWKLLVGILLVPVGVLTYLGFQLQNAVGSLKTELESTRSELRSEAFKQTREAEQRLLDVERRAFETSRKVGDTLSALNKQIAEASVRSRNTSQIAAEADHKAQALEHTTREVSQKVTSADARMAIHEQKVASLLTQVTQSLSDMASLRENVELQRRLLGATLLETFAVGTNETFRLKLTPPASLHSGGFVVEFKPDNIEKRFSLTYVVNGVTFHTLRISQQSASAPGDFWYPIVGTELEVGKPAYEFKITHVYTDNRAKDFVTINVRMSQSLLRALDTKKARTNAL